MLPFFVLLMQSGAFTELRLGVAVGHSGSHHEGRGRGAGRPHDRAQCTAPEIGLCFRGPLPRRPKTEAHFDLG